MLETYSFFRIIVLKISIKFSSINLNLSLVNVANKASRYSVTLEDNSKTLLSCNDEASIDF